MHESIKNYDATVTRAPERADGFCLKCLESEDVSDFKDYVQQHIGNDAWATIGNRIVLTDELQEFCDRIAELAVEAAERHQGRDNPCEMHAERREDVEDDREDDDR